MEKHAKQVVQTLALACVWDRVKAFHHGEVS